VANPSALSSASNSVRRFTPKLFVKRQPQKDNRRLTGKTSCEERGISE